MSNTFPGFHRRRKTFNILVTPQKPQSTIELEAGRSLAGGCSQRMPVHEEDYSSPKTDVRCAGFSDDEPRELTDVFSE